MSGVGSGTLADGEGFFYVHSSFTVLEYSERGHVTSSVVR